MGDAVWTRREKLLPKVIATMTSTRPVCRMPDGDTIWHTEVSQTVAGEEKKSDYVQYGKVYRSEGEICVTFHSVTTPLVPVTDGVQRSYLRFSGYVIRRSEKGCDVFFAYRLTAKEPPAWMANPSFSK